MCESCGHAIIFEAAGGIHTFILQPQRARIEADIFADLIGTLEEGLTFADGDDLLGGREGKEFAKAPYSGEAEGIGAVGPLRLEFGEPAGDRQSIPLVDDIDEVATKRTREMRFAEVERGRASGVQTLLKRLGCRGSVPGWRSRVLRHLSSCSLALAERFQWVGEKRSKALRPQHPERGPRIYVNAPGPTVDHCTGDLGPTTSDNFDDRSLALVYTRLKIRRCRRESGRVYAEGDVTPRMFTDLRIELNERYKRT
jgi:hypothetical protein